MEEKRLKLEIITLEGVKYTGEVNFLVAPGVLGSLGILPHHASLLTKLEIGQVKLKFPDNTEEYFVTGEGLLKVEKNNVTILVDSAAKVDEIDLQGEQALLKKLQTSLSTCAELHEREHIKRDIKLVNSKLNLLDKFRVKQD